MRLPLLLAVGILSLSPLAAQLPQREPLREWKTAEGQAFQAAIVGVEGSTATLRAANGQRSQLPLASLSPEDQAFVRDWQKKQPIKVVMPDTAGVELSAIRAEVVSEDPKNNLFVYRTQHFEFESQGKFTQSLLREVARNFEATYELVKALPWGVDPKPRDGEYFRARLVLHKDTYIEEGGPPNSGGVYMRRNGKFLVPFDSIGLKVVGNSYAKDNDFENDTLVHELTHQMMNDWLWILPQWVIEGTAEYTANLPLRNGKFRVSAAKSGLRDYLEEFKRRGDTVPQPYPLEELFFITNPQWNAVLSRDPAAARRLYFTSFLLVYYFMHLDGDGDGQLFVRYFREMDEARQQVDAYLEALAAFKKNPEVEVQPDGESFRYPSTLTPPQPPAIMATPEAEDAFRKKALEILLNGRTPEVLMKDIRAAYARLGIRL